MRVSGWAEGPPIPGQRPIDAAGGFGIGGRAEGNPSPGRLRGGVTLMGEFGIGGRVDSQAVWDWWAGERNPHPPAPSPSQ